MIAVLALLSAVALPRSSYAQFTPECLTVQGAASVEATVYQNGENGPTTSYYLSSGATTLDLTYQDGDLTMTINAQPPYGFASYDFTMNEGGSPFTPPFTLTSGSGSFFVGGPDGSTGDYFISSDGSVVADMLFYFPDADGSLSYQVLFQGSTIPEPSSIVQAAIAAVVLIGVAVWRLRSQGRPSPQP